jgi:hypothetical protein
MRETLEEGVIIMIPPPPQRSSDSLSQFYELNAVLMYRKRRNQFRDFTHKPSSVLAMKIRLWLTQSLVKSHQVHIE